MLLPLVALALSAQEPSFELSTRTHWDGLGMTVFYLDDLNGDGYLEFGTSAFCTDLNNTNGGTVAIFDGATQQFMRRHDGWAHQARLGEWAANVGDVDADGYADYAGGARQERFGGYDTGSVYVWSGLTGALIHRFDGVESGGDFGLHFAGVGDLNGDGHADIAVAAPLEDHNRGVVRVYGGKNGQKIFQVAGPTGRGRFGSGLCSPGDVDDDGVPDIAIGAPYAFRQSGEVFVYSGRTREVLLHVSGIREYSRLGWRLGAVGDVTGDGDPEMLVAEPCFDGLWLVNARTGALVRQHQGQVEPHKLGTGHAFASCGDIDGDGYPDYVFGRPGEWDYVKYLGPGSTTNLVSGHTGKILGRFAHKEEDDSFGSALAIHEAARGRGRPGLLIGAPAAGVLGVFAPGEVYGYSLQGYDEGY